VKQADLSDKPGLAVSWPNTHFPFYNMLFLTEELTDADVLRDRVQETATYMRTNAYPPSLRYVSSLPGSSQRGRRG
jgi:hypothetical protein